FFQEGRARAAPWDLAPPGCGGGCQPAQPSSRGHPMRPAAMQSLPIAWTASRHPQSGFRFTSRYATQPAWSPRQPGNLREEPLPRPNRPARVIKPPGAASECTVLHSGVPPVSTHAPHWDDGSTGHLVVLGSGPQAEWEHAMQRLAAVGPLLLVDT